MFGYVRPLKGELKVREYEAYRAAYCGLCRCLGDRFGLPARFLVSYDLTCVFWLLSCREQAVPTRRCRCPACPARTRLCAADSEALTQAAQLNILLSYHKLRDTAQDERGRKRLKAKAGALFYRRAYRKAAAALPALDELIRQQLDQLAALERDGCASLDRTADAFAQILAGCAVLLPDDLSRRAGQEVLYHVGRYLYLTDALDDLQQDAASGAYNPAAARYGAPGGVLAPEDEAALAATIELSISRAAAALELLEPQWSGEILRNIVYLGLPSVLQSVRAGTFRRKDGKRTHKQAL